MVYEEFSRLGESPCGRSWSDHRSFWRQGYRAVSRFDREFRRPFQHDLVLSMERDAGDAGRPVDFERIERLRFAAFARLRAIIRAHRAADAILFAEILDEDALGPQVLSQWPRAPVGSTTGTRKVTQESSQASLSPSFLRTTPEKNPRTECGCQPVTAMMA